MPLDPGDRQGGCFKPPWATTRDGTATDCQNMTDCHTRLPAKRVSSLGRLEIVFVGFALAAAMYTLARPAKTSAQPRALPFESVQTDLFSVPNSYSNAWADFDNDGDLDLAVSLG